MRAITWETELQSSDPKDRAEPKADSYDVVVVGSGLGGLASAAMLARAGLGVLLVERGAATGGYAHGFKRGPYTFDPACHFTADRSLLDHLLAHLGVSDQVEIIELDHFYLAHLPDYQIHAPLGFEAFVEEHVRLFPEQEKGLREFFALCEEVHASAHRLPPQLSLKDLDEAAAKYPRLFQYEKATMQEVLDEHFSDLKVKAACAAAWPYPGSPPEALSFLTMAQIIMLHVEGTISCLGGFQSLVDALQLAFLRSGGELLLDTSVVRIGVEDGRATGVMLDGGRFVRAGAVISNADARLTFETLVGPEHLPAAFLRKLRRMVPSLSAFIVFAATDLDLSQYPVSHETFLHLSYDHDAIFRDMLQGKPGGLWLNVPTLVDPTLAPEGHHTLTMTSLVPYDIGSPWEQERERFARDLVRSFHHIIPGLEDQIEVLETATPLTLERYAGNDRGATYGWANTPRQTASRRLPRVTPIEGLFLAGHWTHPGTGSLRCLVSGLHTAMMYLSMLGMDLPQLEPDTELPPW